MKTEFETAGDIREVDLLAAFVALWRHRTTGVVSFSRPGASSSFSLADGEVVSVSSIEPRFESAAILVRAGKLDAIAVERLGIPEGSDASLAALQAGILTRREWRWGEKIRAIEILADLLAWPEGKYYFDADARPAAGEFTLAVPRLLLELFLRSRDRHFVDHQLGATDAPLGRSEDFEREFATFGLTADAESVVRLIDGHASAQEIARSAPADEFAVHKLLAALTTLGLVRAERGPEDEVAAAADAVRGDSEELRTSEEFDAGRMPDERPGEDDSPDEPVSEPEAVWPSAAPPDISDDLVTRRTELWDSPIPPPAAPSSLDTFPLPNLRQDRDTEDLGRGGPSGFDPLPPADDMAERPRQGSGAIVGWFIAGLVVAVAAIVFWRSRSVSEPGAAVTTPREARAIPPTAAPVAVAVAAVPSPVPTSPAAPAPTPQRILPAAPVPPRTVPTRAAPTRPAPTAPPAPRPTRTIARAATTRPSAPAPAAASTRAPAPVPTAAAAPAVSAASRATWVSRAARDRRRLAGEAGTRYAIQLELACEVPSLVEAWKHDRPADSMWLLPTAHRGRDCFKVLWGRYPSLEAARRAKSGIPAFFTTSANRPAIVSVR